MFLLGIVKFLKGNIRFSGLKLVNLIKPENLSSIKSSLLILLIWITTNWSKPRVSLLSFHDFLDPGKKSPSSSIFQIYSI